MTWGFTRRNARFQFHHFYLLQEKNPNYAAKEESGFEKKTETRANECHTNARLFEAYGRCYNLFLFDCFKAFYFSFIWLEVMSSIDLLLMSKSEYWL